MAPRTPLEVQDPDRLQVVADLDLGGRCDTSFDEMAHAAAALLDTPSGCWPRPLVVRADGSASDLLDGRRPPVNLG